MVITSLRREKIYVWRPPSVVSNYKIQVITDSETYDVNSYCEKASFKSTIQPGVGKFEIQLLNPSDKFKDVFSPEDTVKLFKDYSASAATTHRQTGVIESVDQSNHRVKIKGKGIGKSLLDQSIVGEYSSQEVSTILTDIISQVNEEISDNFTTAKVNTTSETIDISFNNKTAMECIEILCQIAGFDFYVGIDADTPANFKDCHFFAEKTIENTTDAVVHSYNLLEIKGFSEDVEKVKNKIRVYGAIIDGIQILYTTDDATSITDYGLREEIITDTSLNSDAEAKTKGDAELALKKDPPIVGEVKSTLLVGLNPGDMLRVSAPAAGIAPDTYKVVEFEDIIENNNIPRTKIKLEKWKPSIPIEFRELFLKQKETQEITNINKLEHSYLFTFDDSTNIDDANSNDYDTDEGYLTFTGAAGYMQSDAKDTGSNVTKFEVRASGENLVGNVTYEVSVDNGVSWQTVNLNTLTTALSDGHQLKIKVTTTSTDSKISTLAILYTT